MDLDKKESKIDCMTVGDLIDGRFSKSSQQSARNLIDPVWWGLLLPPVVGWVWMYLADHGFL